MNPAVFSPDYSHITGLLQHLNDEELKELLQSDEKLKTLINDIKQVHDIEAEKEMLIAGNKSIAEYNLSKKPLLEEQRKQVEETRKIAFELKDSLIEKKKKIENCQKSASSETLLALLQAAMLEKDEEAEALVERFTQNEVDVEDFLPRYLEIRKVAHLRRFKAEKLANILQGTGNSVSIPTKPQRLRKPPPPPNVPTGNPNSTRMPSPYPNMNRMPMNHFPPPTVNRPAPQPPSGYPPNNPVYNPTRHPYPTNAFYPTNPNAYPQPFYPSSYQYPPR